MIAERWPALPLESWLPTYETLHRWTQIVGKTRLWLAPFQNHWWHCALYLSARGLTTSPMPYDHGAVEVELDFLDDTLRIRTSGGHTASMPLEDRSVASFYHEYRALLQSAAVDVRIAARPNEIADATPFARDTAHAAYDGDAVRRWWRALLEIERVFLRFRARFAGKCSPFHFWWGGFDVSCTRFSGRPAPEYTGSVPNTPAYVMKEGYSHECISAGWWPGVVGSPIPYPAFYAYAYPEPDGCSTATIKPSAAYYHPDMREWILPYDAVRLAPDPDAMILEFLEATYHAAATLGGWDIEALRASPLAFADHASDVAH